MAGGIGSRFWPMSSPEQPKQFIDVLGVGRTLLQLTVDRFGSSFSPERTWIVTSANYHDIVRKQLPDIPDENILLEPCMRNTAPCIGYVVWKILQRFPEARLVVTPADHFVVNGEEFRRVIAKGIDFVTNNARVLTLGMKPTRPDTGYGYIHKGKPVEETGAFEVRAFKEKPVLEVAKQYLASGGYYWNAGIFIMRADTAEAAIRRFEPELADLLDQMSASFYTAQEQKEVGELFPKCKAISIDYAVMEPLGGHTIELNGKPSSVYVLPSDFGWSDLGTWGSLYVQLPKDANNNAVIGEENISLIESKNCVVRASGKIKMVLQGMDDFIVVDNDDTLLVCKKDQEQRIKEFCKRIKTQET